jgi:hypothetical protein
VLASIEIDRQGNHSEELLTYQEIVEIIGKNAADHGFGAAATPMGIFEIGCPRRK